MYARAGKALRMLIPAVLPVVLVVGLGGCVAVETGFDSPAPSKRIDAIVDASTLEDDESLVELVKKLRSFDQAERMFAIRSLQIRTGETLGYNHGARHWQRVEAYDRWVEYLRERGIETSSIVRERDEASSEGTDESSADGENG